jgi:hypothetical protein
MTCPLPTPRPHGSPSEPATYSPTRTSRFGRQRMTSNAGGGWLTDEWAWKRVNCRPPAPTGWAGNSRR